MGVQVAREIAAYVVRLCLAKAYPEALLSPASMGPALTHCVLPPVCYCTVAAHSGSAATITVVSPPSHGNVSLAHDGSFVYTAGGTPTNDQFTYEVICDGLTSNIATVYLPAPPGE